MSAKRIGVAIAAVSILAAGCGGLNDDGNGTGGSGGSTGISHPTGVGDLVLRVEYAGGFVAPEYLLSRVPTWSLFGDGTLITEGPQIEIYPGPALPNLQATPISEEGVQAILEAARAAGLMNGDAEYGNDCIADAATTVFTTNAGRTTSVVSAYALDVGQPGGTCGGKNEAERRALADFQAKLGDLQSWLPQGSIGQERPYDPTEMRVYVLPYRGDPQLPQQALEWPLAEPLESFGEPVPDAPTKTRCGVVSGEDLGALLSVAQQANELTPWTSGAQEHRLILRPLLPDEHTC